MPERDSLKFSNQLSDAELERLAILSEELGEAQQCIGKILRHGYESRNPKQRQSPTNRENLAMELGDIRYAVQLLGAAGDISCTNVNARTWEKAENIKPYLHHQNGG